MNVADSDFHNWTRNAIREEGVALGWLEEKLFEWCPVAHYFTKNIINGYTIILCSDSKRQWFCKYVLQTLNAQCARPLIPIFGISSIIPQIQDTGIGAVEDMLEIAFKDHYMIWYIGDSSPLYNLALNSKNSFMWTFDDNPYKAFMLESQGIVSDIRLLQLFSILDKTIDAFMFDEIMRL